MTIINGKDNKRLDEYQTEKLKITDVHFNMEDTFQYQSMVSALYAQSIMELSKKTCGLYNWCDTTIDGYLEILADKSILEGCRKIAKKVLSEDD